MPSSNGWFRKRKKMTDENSLDIEGLLGFIDESHDSMEGIEGAFIELENDPENIEIINRIFRPVHSLKGNSGFFGLMNINKFAHRLENLLDFIRRGEIIVNSEIINILLKGVEYLQEMLERAQADPYDNILRPDEEEFISIIEGCKPTPVAGSLQSVIDLENLLNDAIESGIEVRDVALISSLLSQIEKKNQEIKLFLEKQAAPPPFDSKDLADNRYFFNDQELSDDVTPLIRVIDSLAGRNVSSDDDIKQLKKSLSTFKEIFSKDPETVEKIDELMPMTGFLDDELMVGNDDYVSSINETITRILSLFETEKSQDGVERIGEILISGNKVSEEDVNAALQKQKRVGEILVADGKIDKKDLERAVEIQNRQMLKAQVRKQSDPGTAVKSIRIDQGKLDSFANHVGELFINTDGFMYLKKEMEEKDVSMDIMSRFSHMVTAFGGHVESLHDSVMDIRKVPVKTLFQRFPKLVRQLYTSLNKNIRFVVQGEDTVIDKDLLEKIENPLVHILRNSVDHGIEMPEDRVRAQKPQEGTIELNASADENYVSISIIDDGNGIDPEKMRTVAVKKGMLDESEAAELTDKELVNLIFQPGFSTAKTISDVSGRGVGMDVVISTLKECKGTVGVDSVLGRGTSIHIRLPVSKTLVANDAMLVEAAGRVYAINSEDITTTIEMKKNYTDLFEEDKCIRYDDHILKIIDINEFFFSFPNISPDKQQVLVLSIEHKSALLIDRVINHQKIVVKDFSDGYQQLSTVYGVKGYTILGNADIALILDVKKIAALA